MKILQGKQDYNKKYFKQTPVPYDSSEKRDSITNNDIIYKSDHYKDKISGSCINCLKSGEGFIK
jgi:hypothetical protein